MKSTQAKTMKPTSLSYVFPSKYSVYSANVPILSQVCVFSTCDIVASTCVPHSVSLLTSCPVLMKSTQAEVKKPTSLSHVFSSKYSVPNANAPSLSQVCVTSMCDIVASTCVPHSVSLLTSSPVLMKSTQAEAKKPTSLSHVFPSEYSIHSANAPILSQACVSSECDITVRMCVSESAPSLASCPVSIKFTEVKAVKPTIFKVKL